MSRLTGSAGPVGCHPQPAWRPPWRGRLPADAASRERVGRVGELEREVDRLNREHMALEATVDQVAARLDATIRKLKASVEG